jgi:hypothetical protein
MSTEAADEGTLIWRYMSLPKFLSMLTEHSLFFARPATFDVRWEGLFPPSFYTNTMQYARDHGENLRQFADELTKRQKMHQYGHFVNCWHVGDEECDAMWRLYGLSPEGIAIQSTKADLKNCLHVDGGDVLYYDPNENIRTRTIFGPRDILWKRVQFSWEREFRVWDDDGDLLEKIDRGEAVCEEDL